MPRSELKINKRFRRTCLLHLQDRKISQARNLHDAGRKQSRVEDGGDLFLRNISLFLADYTALFPRRYRGSGPCGSSGPPFINHPYMCSPK
jgi:hypothetical protein